MMEVMKLTDYGLQWSKRLTKKNKSTSNKNYF